MARTALTGNTIFYVQQGGTNPSDIMDATNPATPAGTMQHVWEMLYAGYDCAGYVVTIQLLRGGGPLTTGLAMVGNLLGIKGNGQLIIQGTVGSTTDVVVQPTGLSASFVASNGVYATIRWLTMDHQHATQDFTMFAQHSSIQVEFLRFINNATPFNYFSLFLNAFLFLTGDIDAGAGAQALLYASDASSTYPAINNAPSITRNGALTNGSPVVTGISTAGFLPGQIVRGGNVPVGTRIASVDSGSQITLDHNANASLTQSLRIGGILINFTTTPTIAGGALIWATNDAGLNWQGVEYNGSFIGRTYVCKNGGGLDHGATTLGGIPGTLPGYVDAASAGYARDDSTGIDVMVPAVPPGIISGTSSAGRVRFRQLLANGQWSTHADGHVVTDGAGSMLFHNHLGQIYLQASPMAASGISNWLQFVGTISGNHPYIASQGSDANIGFTFLAKGNGPALFQADMQRYIDRAGTTEMLRLTNAGAYFPATLTTAAGANAFLHSGTSPANLLMRSTSSSRYKRDVEDVSSKVAHNLLNARPVWYRSKASGDNPAWSWYGFVAEELAEIDPRLVHWAYADEDLEDVVEAVPHLDDKGQLVSRLTTFRKPKAGAKLKPDGVQYDRLAVLHHVLIQDLMRRLESLEQPTSKT